MTESKDKPCGEGKDKFSKERLERTIARTNKMFDEGRIKSLVSYRRMKCDTAGGNGWLCEWIDKTAQGRATCEGPTGTLVDLCDMHKRRDFRCPIGLF